MSDLSKSFAQLLVDMINVKNPEAELTIADIELGAVAASTHDPQRNSEVVVTGVVEANTTGTQTFYYNRLSLPAIAALGAADGLEFEAAGQTQLSQLVSVFNTRFKTNLQAGVDYTDAALPTLGNADVNVTLTALANSYVYLGNIELTIKPALRDLAEVLPNNVLDGLTYTG